MKNDQEGSCERVPRHVYANTFNSQLCPLGVLAQYFLIFSAVLMDHIGLLFLGFNQGDRLLKGFKALLMENGEEIRRMGYDLEDLGTHSIHKGTTTYTSGGTTASPGGISISIRGGWTM
eukprot:2919621-Ditylum_brightwellii.AAC.1